MIEAGASVRMQTRTGATPLLTAIQAVRSIHVCCCHPVVSPHLGPMLGIVLAESICVGTAADSTARAHRSAGQQRRVAHPCGGRSRRRAAGRRNSEPQRGAGERTHGQGSHAPACCHLQARAVRLHALFIRPIERGCLSYVRVSRNRPMASLLLERGADITATDDAGNQPIHVAASCGTRDPGGRLIS